MVKINEYDRYDDIFLYADYIKENYENETIFQNFHFKWCDTSYIIEENNEIIAIFFMNYFDKNHLVNELEINFRWVKKEFRGKNIYPIFLNFLKDHKNIFQIYSDKIMNIASIKSTLKIKNIILISENNKNFNEKNKDKIMKLINNDIHDDYRFLIQLR